jgi:hypothetical protein
MSTAPHSVYQFSVYAGYHQFYLQDKDATGDTGAIDFWTQAAFERMLATHPGIIGVGTGTYGHVPVTVEIYQDEPLSDPESCDHLVEASLALNSGQLLICGCPDEEAGQITLTPGNYRVRVYCDGLATVKNEEGDDRYRIALWLGKPLPVRVIKQWSAAFS